MFHRELSKALNCIFQDVINTEQILGGKLLVLDDYFWQILPVNSRTHLTSQIDAYMKMSSI